MKNRNHFFKKKESIKNRDVLITLVTSDKYMAKKKDGPFIPGVLIQQAADDRKPKNHLEKLLALLDPEDIGFGYLLNTVRSFSCI